MKISYDKIADAMYIYFRKGKVAKTIKIKRGLLVDVDKKEVFWALKFLMSPDKSQKRKLAKSLPKCQFILNYS